MNSGASPSRVVVRGAGEMASGVIHTLHSAGYEVIALEKDSPECIRRMVCFAEAVFDRQATVENVTAVPVKSVKDITKVLKQHRIPVIIDPDAKLIPSLRPMALIDARMLKDADDCHTELAPIVVGLGPGFIAPENCHAVIETNRGDRLGAVIYQGSAEADTGRPAPLDGVTLERVLRAPIDGIIRSHKKIGDTVKSGEILADIAGNPVRGGIGGVIRGMIRDGSLVRAGQKIGDIDPRGDSRLCFVVSDKAQAIGRGTVEAIELLKRSLLQS